MQKGRDFTKPWLRTAIVTKTEPVEPPYEVIEFPSHRQYSNTTFAPPKAKPNNDGKVNERKCDLCGSTSAQFRCNMCAQQTFCASCDLMYHRHPKRQHHIRQRMTLPSREGYDDPPLPPKRESNSAPVPPPRRNKLLSRTATLNSHQGSVRKDRGIMESLKRLVVGGINPTPTQPTVIREEQPPKFTPISRPTGVDQQSSGKDSGYLDWDTRSNQGSGSFSAFNGPSFPSTSAMMQAQSMAQLNCPNCHVHGGMANWDWNRSQINLHGFGPWSQNSAAGNAWHSSMMFPPAYRMPPTSALPRRPSLRSQRRGHRCHKYSSEDDLHSDTSADLDRKFKIPSPLVRGVSPALSRRSRRTAPSDTDDDSMSRRHERSRFKKRPLPASREVSPTCSRRGYRKKYDDDTMSAKSVGSRRSLKSTDNSFLRKRRVSSTSDSDDELSDRDTENKPQSGKPPLVEKYKPSLIKAEAKAVNIYHGEAGAEEKDWQCEHCTFLNVKSSSVCDVCCKSRATNDIQKPTEQLVDTMNKLQVSSTATDEKKKGDEVDQDAEPIIQKITVSTGTSPPPQTISTQTYQIPNNLVTRNGSFFCEDYHRDYNLAKKSNSVISSSNEKQSSLSEPVSLARNHFSSMNSELKNQIKHGVEIVKLLKEAEELNFSIEDLTTALCQCADTNPIEWLIENWSKMIDTVVTFATNYGQEQPENTIGTISTNEARAALHLHSGDMLAAATECIRQRLKKYNQLMSKGHFTREDVVTVLTANHGDLDAAYIELNKSTLKPYLMKIWGPPQGLDNESGDTSIFNNQQLDPEPQLDQKENFMHIRTWLNFIKIPETINLENEWSESLPPDVKRPFYMANGHKIINRYNSCDNLRRSKVHQSLETLFLKKHEQGCAKSLLINNFSVDYPSLDGSEQDIQYARNISSEMEENIQLRYCKSEDDTNTSKDDTLKIISGFDSENYYSADEKIQNRLSSTRGNEKETFVDLNALDRTAKTHLDDLIIEMSDTTSTVLNKVWVNNPTENTFSGKLLSHLNHCQRRNWSKFNDENVSSECETDSLAEKSPPHTGSSEEMSISYEKGILEDVTNSKSNETNSTSEAYNTSQIKIETISSNCSSINIPATETIDSEQQQKNDSKKDLDGLNQWAEITSPTTNQHSITNRPIRDTQGSKTQINNIRGIFINEVEDILKYRKSKECSKSDKHEVLIHDVKEVTNVSTNLQDKMLCNDTSKKLRIIEMNLIPAAEKVKTLEETIELNSHNFTDIAAVNTNSKIIETQKNEGNSLHTLSLETENSQENTTAENILSQVSSTSDDENLNHHSESLNSEKNNGDVKIVFEIQSFGNNKKRMDDEGDVEEHSTGLKRENSGSSFENKLVSSDEKYTSISNLEIKMNYKLGSEIKNSRVTSSNLDNITKNLTQSLETNNKGDTADNINQNLFYVNEDEESSEIRSRRCVFDGLVSTYNQAQMAIQLMELKFDRSQSLDAAVECSDIYSAIAYLQQECQLCTEKFSMKQMFSMLGCEHKCCQECAQMFFSVQINENSIDDCVCPFCQKPDVRHQDSESTFNYFSNLDILLKSILKPQTHELFQQKLRDRTLMQDPNFKWCPHCSFGFITEIGGNYLICPSCKKRSCNKCGEMWQKEHEILTCEKFGLWLKTQNDLTSELITFLDDYGITCPRCFTKFVLVKGGCMHLTCTNCKFEFCSDCQKPFSMGSHCNISEYCAKLGLHAHHPRNCLFYLRDKEPGELKRLLIANGIEIKLHPSSNFRCRVQLQKETENGLEDIQCGSKVDEAGLCKCHLKEFLSRIITTHKLETIDLLNVDDLETLVMREGIQRPPRGYHTPEQEYYQKLYEDVFMKNLLHLSNKKISCFRIHYVEYLAKLIKKNKIDPIIIFELGEILQEFRRRGLSLPIRKANTFEHEYRRYCIQVVKEELPLD